MDKWLNKIHCGDAKEVLTSLPSGCAQMIVTSPPYWGLRDYGVDAQLGLEPTPEEYVAKMVDVFREVRRVLRDDGALWLNLGDSYNNFRVSMNGQTVHGGEQRNKPPGRRAVDHALKEKDLVGIPWRVAFALQADGWWLRQDIIWHKPNPMPESATDRCTKSHEYLFLLTKSAKYYYDAEAIYEPTISKQRTREKFNGESAVDTKERGFGSHCGTYIEGRNKRSVWTINTQSYPGAHFATFPEKLVEPCILAGSSPQACEQCGAPWKRVVEKPKPPEIARSLDAKRIGMFGRNDNERRMGQQLQDFYDANPPITKGWEPTCSCKNEGSGKAVVLDPFIGSGTTAVVAKRLFRNYIGIELNPEYIKLAEKRIPRHVQRRL